MDQLHGRLLRNWPSFGRLKLRRIGSLRSRRRTDPTQKFNGGHPMRQRIPALLVVLGILGLLIVLYFLPRVLNGMPW